MIRDWNDQSVSYKFKEDCLVACNTDFAVPICGYGCTVCGDMYAVYARQKNLYIYVNGKSYAVGRYLKVKYFKILVYEFFSMSYCKKNIIKKLYNCIGLKVYIDSNPQDKIDDDETFFLSWLCSIINSKSSIQQFVDQWQAEEKGADSGKPLRMM